MAEAAGQRFLYRARRASGRRTDQPLLRLPSAAAHAPRPRHHRTDPRWPADGRARAVLEAVPGGLGKTARAALLTPCALRGWTTGWIRALIRVSAPAEMPAVPHGLNLPRAHRTITGPPPEP